MKDILGKINNAIDVITDAMVEQIPAINEVGEYSYSDLTSYVKKMANEYPQIKKFTIAISKSSEFSEKVYASERFIVRIVMLNGDKSPIVANGKSDEYLGTVVIAEAIDLKLKEKMNGEPKKTFIYTGGK